MTRHYSGGCACGAIRYETKAEPIVENHCQCRDCRVRGDSGNEKLYAFCPTCGTPAYLTFAAMPELVAIHATSLDDPAMFNPQMVTYAIRGHAWDTMDPALPKFERMPG
jgi:hypothetical protein